MTAIQVSFMHSPTSSQTTPLFEISDDDEELQTISVGSYDYLKKVNMYIDDDYHLMGLQLVDQDNNMLVNLIWW